MPEFAASPSGIPGPAAHFDMKQFLKTNLVLVAGVVLPLALMLVFYIAGAVTRASVADPRYDMVFAADNPDRPWWIGLEGNALTIRYNPANNMRAGYEPPGPRLYLFNHQTMTVEPLAINYNHIINGVVEDPVIEELNTHALSVGYTSPDGYRFTDDYYRGGLFADLFDFGDNRNTGTLRKQGRSIRLAGGPAYYGNSQLIVWVGGKRP
jgi:hypothetical protein